jgi:hypothetical protein
MKDCLKILGLCCRKFPRNESAEIIAVFFIELISVIPTPGKLLTRIFAMEQPPRLLRNRAGATPPGKPLGKATKQWRLTEPFLTPQEVVREKLIDEAPAAEGGRATKWGFRRWAVAHRLAVKGGNPETVHLCRSWLESNATPAQLAKCGVAAQIVVAKRPVFPCDKRLAQGLPPEVMDRVRWRNSLPPKMIPPSREF